MARSVPSAVQLALASPRAEHGYSSQPLAAELKAVPRRREALGISSGDDAAAGPKERISAMEPPTLGDRQSAPRPGCRAASSWRAGACVLLQLPSTGARSRLRREPLHPTRHPDSSPVLRWERASNPGPFPNPIPLKTYEEKCQECPVLMCQGCLVA